ncbi:MAG TPA: TonB-dependent receptor [Steroidobacteraceae bacterium]|jgi:outer membrane receptor protein involved in Fe transport
MHDLRHDFETFHRPGPRASRSRLFYGAMAAAALAGPVFAQQQPQVAATQGAATDATNTDAAQLGQVVVTATRRAEAINKVPMSISALTQASMDMRGIKDIQDVARFTPGIYIDNSGTNNISIRGIASSGGAGTTGIYIDDTPIQMRGLAFNPDEALPQAFDLQRVEVLRGPQGTLFGAGSEGGTVRYITMPPNLTGTSVYSRDEVSFTQGGAPSYEAGFAGGTAIIPGSLGARATVWYRHDGGYIDLIDPVSLNTLQHNANYANSTLVRLDALWAINDTWRVRPGFYYQSRVSNNTSDYWPLYSNPDQDRFVSANPDRRERPDKFYLPSLQITGDFGKFQLIENASYYHRTDTTGYDGTIYNLGFYQSGAVFASVAGGYPLLLDGAGVHLPGGATNYRSPASVDNGQQNFTEELRLQSSDPDSALTWTTGLFYSQNRQSYLELIHDPLLNELTQAYLGVDYGSVFCNFDATAGACTTPYQPILYDPRFPNDSYFLQTFSKDTQIAWYGQAIYAFTKRWLLTLGARESRLQYTFNTLTGGPQLFLTPQTGTGGKTQTVFTPKVSLSYQHDNDNLYYATYAKGFRPGGANNPVPYAACASDFQNFGISSSPQTFSSDSVDSYEIGAKNNFAGRVQLATSVYYIRWNDIQQSVVPPVCQISFIANLGQATAKGADVQLDIALDEHLTAEITAGYTDARYTRDARFSAAEITPIVSNGDAITGESGQPGPPVTASIGLQYNFQLFDRDSFVRFDDEFQGRAKWMSPAEDPNTQQYDAANYVLSSTNFMSIRGGMRFSAWRFEGFVNNVANSHTVTNYAWSIDPGVCATPTPACESATRLQTQWALPPRTFGITAIYRY